MSGSASIATRKQARMKLPVNSPGHGIVQSILSSAARRQRMYARKEHQRTLNASADLRPSGAFATFGLQRIAGGQPRKSFNVIAARDGAPSHGCRAWVAT